MVFEEPKIYEARHKIQQISDSALCPDTHKTVPDSTAPLTDNLICA